MATNGVLRPLIDLATGNLEKVRFFMNYSRTSALVSLR